MDSRARILRLLMSACVAAAASPAVADEIVRAPAFGAETLDSLPREAWITNGGNLANQRYSPLTQINRDNVANLKAEWRASLEGSGVTPRGSNQAESIYYEGTLYIATSVNDVFAIDADTNLMYICASDGAWGATGGDPDFDIEPGAVYSGGAVHSTQIPRRGILAALDVTTNRLAWRQQWPNPCYSGSMTTAGGLVFVGRNDGRLTALDTRNGDKLWEFQTDGGVMSADEIQDVAAYVHRELRVPAD